MVFLLVPLVWVPFPALLVAFYWLLIISTAISVHLWLRVLKWPLGATDVVVCVTLTLGSFAAVQGIKLQQLSLLVAALMAAAVACVAGGHLFVGGALLALATIKPRNWHGAWEPGLLFWAASDWAESVEVCSWFCDGDGAAAYRRRDRPARLDGHVH